MVSGVATEEEESVDDHAHNCMASPVRGIFLARTQLQGLNLAAREAGESWENLRRKKRG